MFIRILLPLDGSALAECTIPHALALAQLADAELVLVHILEGGGIQAGVDPVEWHLRETAAQNYIHTVRAKLQGMGMATQCVLLPGSPPERIVEQVEKLGTDLVLVSTHGQSGRTGWTLGSVARKLVEAVGTSVMLVDPQIEPPETPAFLPAKYRTIMLALDGSRRAECILPIAERLAEIQDAELVLAHVVQHPGILSWAFLSEEERHLAEQLVERAYSLAEGYLQEMQTRQGKRCTVVLSQASNVATELNEIARRHQVDLILVSAHGAAANPLRAFGDTVYGILSNSRQPVLIYQDQPIHRANVPEAAPIRGRLEDLDSYSPLAA